jgi:U3 small nucleolar RNA-associated protein 15
MTDTKGIPTTNYQKLKLKQYPKTPTSLTSEARYWKNFKFTILLRQISAVTSIDFSPVAPHEFAISSSSRVQIFDPNTNKVSSTLSRFKDVVYSGSFRNDGKLLVAGGEEGVVRLCDVSTKFVLRNFKGHEKAVHVTKFSPNNMHVMSASDDRTVRCWDMTTSEELIVLKGHKDHVRCGAPQSADVWITGSYDHLVRLWDVRTGESINILDHGHPVESVLVYPGGGIIVSAGGPTVKIWDILGGGRVLDSLENHQKTVTSLCLDSERSRLFTGSLDRHIKVFSTTSYKMIHSIKYTAPILSMGISPDSSHLVTGMSDGMLSIRHRVVDMEKLASTKKKRTHSMNSWKYFVRGRDDGPSDSDFVVETSRKQKLKPYNKYLRKFQYRKALDAALELNQPVVIVSLLEEFIRRKTLEVPLVGRDEEKLKELLKFILKQIVNPKYCNVLIKVMNSILDIYALILGQSQEIDDLFEKIKYHITIEINFQKQLNKVLGTLDLLFSANTENY